MLEWGGQGMRWRGWDGRWPQIWFRDGVGVGLITGQSYVIWWGVAGVVVPSATPSGHPGHPGHPQEDIYSLLDPNIFLIDKAVEHVRTMPFMICRHGPLLERGSFSSTSELFLNRFCLYNKVQSFSKTRPLISTAVAYLN